MRFLGADVISRLALSPLLLLTSARLASLPRGSAAVFWMPFMFSTLSFRGSRLRASLPRRETRAARGVVRVERDLGAAVVLCGGTNLSSRRGGSSLLLAGLD